MYSWGDSELPAEEVDSILLKAAEKIHLYGMETAAILTLESVKPLVYVGGELSRVVLAPFLPALGPDYNTLGDKLIYVFEDRKNIEKLIQILEKMAAGKYVPPGKEGEEPEPEEKPAEGQAEAPVKKEKEPEEKTERKGWRRWLPF
jgi:ribosomal protein L12E/L44/L45/RPP1/RPP2